MKKANRLAGKGALAYRVGTYRSFLAAMLRGARRKAPLARLNTQAEGDLTNALLSAWARVCDVLTFYQERIANEGFLSTATEPVSVLYLTSAIAERRRPAVGAQTHLALQLIDTAGQPDRLTIDAGPSVAVQNTPPSGQLPAVFECAERIELRPAWNALTPAINQVVQRAELWPGCRSLLLAGTATGVRAGSALLLSVTADRTPHSWLVIVDQIQVDRARGCTMIAWNPAIARGKEDWRLPVTDVTLFERNAGLFGRTAMAWADVPEKTKEAIGVRQGGLMALDPAGFVAGSVAPAAGLWRRPEGSLPPSDVIRVLLATEGGALLAATATGIFRTADRGLEWQALTLPQGRHDVLSLVRDAGGKIYAGTAEGMLMASADDGDSWTLLPRTNAPPRTVMRRVAEAVGLKSGSPPGAGEPEFVSAIRALTLSDDEEHAPTQIYAGTDQGVFATLPEGPSWTGLNEGFPGFSSDTGTADVSVVSLAAYRGSLIADTNRGLFTRRLRSSRWVEARRPAPGAAAPNFAKAGRDGVAFVGTASGVLASVDLHRWTEFNAFSGSPPPPVFSLTMRGEALFAVAGSGILASSPVFPNWLPANTQDLTLFEADGILSQDPHVPGRPMLDLPNLRGRFERFGIALADEVTVTELSPFLWELVETGAKSLKRVFRAYGGTHLRVTQLVANQAAPDACLADAGGTLLASLPLGPVLNTEWPDFANSADEIFLDRKIDDLEDGSLMILAPAGSSMQPDPHVYKIKTSEALLHQAFGKQATVTRIAVAPDPALPSFDLRGTSVYLASRSIAPFTASLPDPEPVAGRVLTLAGTRDGLKPGRCLQVSGPRPGAAIVRGVEAPDHPGQKKGPVASADAEAVPALDQQMVSAGLRQTFTTAGIKLSLTPDVMVIESGTRWLIRDGDRAWLLVPPEPLPATGEAVSLRIFAAPIFDVAARPLGGSGEWTLAHRDHVRTIVAAKGDILLLGARSDQQQLSEIVTIGSVALQLESSSTVVTLTAPLQTTYDSAQCRICANVALATQGETVPHEVLGSGKLGQAHQKFRLLRAPLTYTRDPDGHGAHSSLRVQVNSQAGRAFQYGGGPPPADPWGEPWREVSALALAGLADRVFMVLTDSAGGAVVRFGDGVQGARLPSGIENVTARYRFGAGAQGNVPAGSLIALRKRPAGIRSVTNPVAAAGGADAESIDGLRARAPRKFAHFDRLVALSDYQAYAEDFEGVGKVQADLIGGEGEAPVVWLTAATEAGLPISQAPELRDALAAAIEARRSDRLPFRLEGFVAATFDLSLSIVATAVSDPALVKKQVQAALTAEFGYARRDFGEGVDPLRIVDAVRKVPAVVSAKLLALYRTGETPEGFAPLVAAKAGGADALAELLLINPDGIGVGLVVGP